VETADGKTHPVSISGGGDSTSWGIQELKFLEVMIDRIMNISPCFALCCMKCGCPSPAHAQSMVCVHQSGLIPRVRSV